MNLDAITATISKVWPLKNPIGIVSALVVTSDRERFTVIHNHIKSILGDDFPVAHFSVVGTEPASVLRGHTRLFAVLDSAMLSEELETIRRSLMSVSSQFDIPVDDLLIRI